MDSRLCLPSSVFRNELTEPLSDSPPPKALHITKTMKSIEVPETKAASFECEVSHFNVPSMWLKNGVEIEMSEKFKIVVQGKLHQLIIMNTSTEDSAEYTFVCGNDQVSATLTVTRK